jgi:hypothetical protein
VTEETKDGGETKGGLIYETVMGRNGHKHKRTSDMRRENEEGCSLG